MVSAGEGLKMVSVEGVEEEEGVGEEMVDHKEEVGVVEEMVEEDSNVKVILVLILTALHKIKR